MKRKILILNGPGFGDAGDTALADVRAACAELCSRLGLELDFRQTDDPDLMLRWIEKDIHPFDGVIVNPVGPQAGSDGSFPDYRRRLASAAALRKPVVEVRMDNIFAGGAEPGRAVSEPAGGTGLVCGLGGHGYLLAIHALAQGFAPAGAA